LKLEPTIQDWIEEGKLTAGHGRALLAVPDPQLRCDTHSGLRAAD